jgi:hypothetical protein
VALRGEVPRDQDGTPLFTVIGCWAWMVANGGDRRRLSRECIRAPIDKYLRISGLKREDVSTCARCRSCSATPTRA